MAGLDTIGLSTWMPLALYHGSTMSSLLSPFFHCK